MACQRFSLSNAVGWVCGKMAIELYPCRVTGSEECFGFRCFLSQKIGPEGAFDSLIFRIGLLL